MTGMGFISFAGGAGILVELRGARRPDLKELNRNVRRTGRWCACAARPVCIARTALARVVAQDCQAVHEFGLVDLTVGKSRRELLLRGSSGWDCVDIAPAPERVMTHQQPPRTFDPAPGTGTGTNPGSPCLGTGPEAHRWAASLSVVGPNAGVAHPRLGGQDLPGCPAHAQCVRWGSASSTVNTRGL